MKKMTRVLKRLTAFAAFIELNVYTVSIAEAQTKNVSGLDLGSSRLWEWLGKMFG